jgi:hypothetical protein
MKRIAYPIALAVLFTVAYCVAWGQQTDKVSRAEPYGFSGPIHTQKIFHSELNKDPRPEKTRMWIRDWANWQLFDENGNQVETGQLDASGQPIDIVRTQFSTDHHSRTMKWPDGTTNTIEDTPGLFGITEERISVNGKLTSRSELTYDEQGRESAGKYFDSQGTIISHFLYRYDKGLKETLEWNAKGDIINHSLIRYDGDGDEMERTDYDAQGKPFANFRVNKLELLSYWVDPECKCASGAGYSEPGDRTVWYLIDQDGKFQKSMEHHRGRRTNWEPDDGEQYDAAGRLLDRVVYTYARDAHGNWTRRVVSVLDPVSRSMLPIREDTRVLTYY